MSDSCECGGCESCTCKAISGEILTIDSLMSIARNGVNFIGEARRMKSLLGQDDPADEAEQRRREQQLQGLAEQRSALLKTLCDKDPTNSLCGI